MAATAVRLRAAMALALAGSVLPALLVLPPAAATVVGLLVAIAVILPSSAPTGARAAARREG